MAWKRNSMINGKETPSDLAVLHTVWKCESGNVRDEAPEGGRD